MQDLQSFYKKLKELGEEDKNNYVSDPYNEKQMLEDSAKNTALTPQDIANIYNAESSFGQQLVNKKDKYGNESKAKGHFQFLPGTEKDIKERILPKDTEIPLNELKKQALLMNAYTNYNEDRLKKFNLPITKENLYALHHEGPSGGLKAIKQQETPEGKERWKFLMAQLQKKGTRDIASLSDSDKEQLLDILKNPNNYVEQ
jgi:hypothetical protein